MKEKKKALILWKSPWLWNKFLIKKLSKFYIVDHLYINSIQDKNFIEIVDHINKKIEENKIEVVFFDFVIEKESSSPITHKIGSSKVREAIDSLLITGFDSIKIMDKRINVLIIRSNISIILTFRIVSIFNILRNLILLKFTVLNFLL